MPSRYDPDTARLEGENDPSSFDAQYRRELELLRTWFRDRHFSDYPHQIGYEIELLLVGPDYAPACRNLEWIDRYSTPYLMSEVHGAQIEFGTEHYLLRNGLFAETEKHFNDLMNSLYEKENEFGSEGLLIGTYPGPVEGLGSREQLTKAKRYETLDNTLKKNRKGKQAPFRIEEAETWALDVDSLSLNGLCSALHVHLRVTQDESTSFYSAAQAAAGPVLAACCNSPFFGGKELWEETRIPLFEQGLSLQRIFGAPHEQSFLDLFEENGKRNRLLTICDPSLPLERLFHFREQNSVSYRWNRPRVDFDVYGTPHLRIEYRGLPTGPTVVDMVANAAFFIGAVASLAQADAARLLPHAEKNFYASAKEGLEAKLYWDRETKARNLLLETLLPLAEEGLHSLGVDSDDIHRLLGIIEERVGTGRTGSAWQKNFIKQYGKDFSKMIEAYLAHQKSGAPVHTWRTR